MISWFLCCLRKKTNVDKCGEITVNIAHDIIENLYVQTSNPPDILSQQILNELYETTPSTYNLEISIPDLFD